MQNVIEQHDPSVPTITTRILPSAISDLSLIELRAIASEKRDALRRWLSDCLAAEFVRRENEEHELIETESWVLPWHRWTDGDLQRALATTYSWLDVASVAGTKIVLQQIHRAVCTAVCARLAEIDAAVKLAQMRGDK